MALTEAEEPGGNSIGTMTPLPLEKLIKDRNASFASELRARENDALRLAGLSTPTRLVEINELKSANELRALQDEARRRNDLGVWPSSVSRGGQPSPVI